MVTSITILQGVIWKGCHLKSATIYMPLLNEKKEVSWLTTLDFNNILLLLFSQCSWIWLKFPLSQLEHWQKLHDHCQSRHRTVQQACGMLSHENPYLRIALEKCS